MIGRIGCVEILELAVAQIVVASIDDHAADHGSMSTDELGRAVGNNMGTPFERAAEIRSGKCIINHQDELCFSRFQQPPRMETRQDPDCRVFRHKGSLYSAGSLLQNSSDL